MIRLDIDPTNPGQFFGCCGVFELAQRLWPDCTARFEGRRFVVSDGAMDELVAAAASASLEAFDPADPRASALRLGEPFGLRLDWWRFERGLKTWAGQMSVSRIALSLQRELPNALGHGLFDYSRVLVGPDGRKVEPYCFDSRRGASAIPLDLGFSSDALSMETVAFSAAEFFALVGLQRFRPGEVRPRVYRYRVWERPLSVRLAALAVGGVLAEHGPQLQFKCAFRSEYNRAYLPAVPFEGGFDE